MVRLVEFEEPAASLVRLVEDTAPESVIDAAIHQLRLGAAPGDLIAAAGSCGELLDRAPARTSWRPGASG